ncbi:unnamed protein product [Adineta steineri]|uniref:Glutathione S-transferase omega n=1 Tax=Adineta steineri TaxID=433720 RepID=A0A815PAA7_9BILA|nr:unnamed protein product [Adineta steineri]CAF1446198.1 unnamed protein product [Adineta steineri]CAF1629157.1 unnamed protein product [Adineta steineri]CAF1629176.1 unnamed protein product [Adineta steineri]
MTTTKKHLKSDSDCPPLKENQLRLYSMRFCPFVQRTKLVLAAKNIPYEEILINLGDKPDWYIKKHPAADVPLLEWIDGGSKKAQSIPESLVISDYLDNLYNVHRLHPNDPFTKAKQQILLSKYGNVMSSFYKIVRQSEGNNIEELNNTLAIYEEALHDTFFGGFKPGMFDFMIWPWFERFPVISESGFVLNADGKLPKLAKWVEAMKANEVVQKVKVPEEMMKKFFNTVREGKADYDIE